MVGDRWVLQQIIYRPAVLHAGILHWLRWKPLHVCHVPVTTLNPVETKSVGAQNLLKSEEQPQSRGSWKPHSRYHLNIITITQVRDAISAALTAQALQAILRLPWGLPEPIAHQIACSLAFSCA